MRRRHAERALEILRSAHLTEEDDIPFRLEVALAERDDLRAALDWAAVADVELALELAVGLENFWVAHAPHEGRRRLQGLMSSSAALPVSLRARATRVYGSASDMAGGRELAEPLYQKSLAMFREIGDERNTASLLHRLAMCALWGGELERARELAQESLDVSGGRFRLVDIPNYSVIGQVAVQSGDVERGTALVRQSADESGAISWWWWRGGQLSNLAFLALNRNDLQDAEDCAREGLEIVRRQENRQWALWMLAAHARIALARGERERAGLLWGAIEAESERVRYGSWQAGRADYARELSAESSADYLAAVEEGRKLDVWEAAALALGEDELEGQTVP